MTSPNQPTDAERSGERIAKLLARAGVASRREVERMIAEGRVRLGDEVLTTPNTVLPDLSGVSVDGQPVSAAEATRLFLFHKPIGLITAERDPAGRATIYTALRNALPPGTPRLMPVGRLDLNTEGLLLLTNDGELKRAMELPSSGVPRTYRARTFGDISQQQLEELMEGVEIEGVRYGPINANMERRTGRNQWIEMTITEGKNREVRRVLEHLGLQVSRLIRVSYGPFILADLPRGMAGEVRPADVEKFRRNMKLDSSIGVAPAQQRRATPVPSPAPARDRTAGKTSARPAAVRDRGERPARPEARTPEARTPAARAPQARTYASPGKPARPQRDARPERREDKATGGRPARPDDRRRTDAPAKPRRTAERNPETGRAILGRSEVTGADTRRPSSPRPKRGKGWAKPAAPRRPRPRK